MSTKMNQAQYAQLVATLGDDKAREIASTLGGVKGARIKGGKGGHLLNALESKSNPTEAEQKVIVLLNNLFELKEEINNSTEVTEAFYSHFPNFLEGFNLDMNWKDRSKQQ